MVLAVLTPEGTFPSGVFLCFGEKSVNTICTFPED